MTLQSSGAISMEDIEAEYNDEAEGFGYELDSYYGKTRGFPTSGELSYDDFYGTNAFMRFQSGQHTPFFTDTGWKILDVLGSLPESDDNLFYNPVADNTVGVIRIFHSSIGRIYLDLNTNTNSTSTFHTLYIYGSYNTSYTQATASFTSNGGGTGIGRWDWIEYTNPFSAGSYARIALRNS